MLHKLFQVIDKILPARIVYAHCDIPCGIYDPHHAQMSAHTVIRMVNLINELLPQMKPDIPPEQRRDIIHKIQRYTSVKEQHAELCKHEIGIIWGDYFKPEHIQKFPVLHELVFKIMKLGSKARQEVNLQTAEELLEAVNKFAEIFWKTKNVETVRRKSYYPTEREMVYPKV